MEETADSADVVCLSRDFHRSAFVLQTDIIKFNFLMFCALGSTADYVDNISLMFSLLQHIHKGAAFIKHEGMFSC